MRNNLGLENLPIESALDALSKEMGSNEAKRRLLARMEAGRQGYRIAWRPLLTASVAAVAIVGTAFMLWPRPSLASELEEISQTLKGDVSRIETTYLLDAHGHSTLTSRTEIDRGACRFSAPDTATTFYANGVRVDHWGSFNSRQLQKPGEVTARLTSVDEMIDSSEVSSWGVERSVAWDGTVADKYEMVGKGPVQKSVLFVSPKSRYPLRLETYMEGRLKYITLWDYSRPDFDSEWSLIDAAPNRTAQPLFDLDEQRQAFLKAVTSPIATTPLDGGQLNLIGLFLDQSSHLVAITSGNPTNMYRPEYPIKVQGAKTEGWELSGWEGLATSKKIGQRAPVVIDGVPTYAFSAKVLGTIPDTITVEIPVEVAQTGSVKYVPLTAKITRTSLLTNLLTPTNVPFFDQTQRESSTMKTP